MAATAQNPVKPESTKRDPIELLSPKGVDISQSGSVIFNHTGNVKLRHRGVLLFCDQAVQQVTANQVQAIGHVLIVQGDTIIIKADTLSYDGNSRRAILHGRVVFQDRRIILNVSQLDYDLASGVAHYANRGRLVDGRNVLTSREGYYDSRNRQIEMKQGVRLVSPENTLTSEVLIYNTVNRMATLLAPTRITGKEGVSVAQQGQYDTQNSVVQPGVTTETAKYITLSEPSDRTAAPETTAVRHTATTPAPVDENLVASQTNRPIVAGESVTPKYSEAEKKVEKPVVQPAPASLVAIAVDNKSTTIAPAAIKPAETVSVATTGSVMPEKSVNPTVLKTKPALKRPSRTDRPVTPVEEPVNVAALMVPTPKPDEQVLMAVTTPEKGDVAEHTVTSGKAVPVVATVSPAAKAKPAVTTPRPATPQPAVAPAIVLQPAATLPAVAMPVTTAPAPAVVTVSQPAKPPVLQVAIAPTAKRAVKSAALMIQPTADGEISDLERELNRKKRQH